ncbi:hypothetical protein DICVIV_02112 [Dictyocaulus viviparus]|uniref:Chromatin assembly factor 1 subunit A dimerization domain-containing protein n=1 Tax=Dictyocaulus viviparus TaxID=29172 RepID=A0A0D8YAW8_DICVI|nr:hypothetical protein DICVIV_02112 [Dictyocaulus viviparus]
MTDVDPCTNENDISVDVRGLKRPSSASGVDPLKKLKASNLKLLIDSVSSYCEGTKIEDDLTTENTSPATSSGRVTPLTVASLSAANSSKKLTPRMTKEEREAERARRALHKKLKEEERVRAKALEEKKRRASARFIGFFSKVEKKKPEVADKTEDELWYKPFEVKDGMILAPIQRRRVLQLDDDILKQDRDIPPNYYLSSLSTNPRKLVGVPVNSMRAKLYQFHDNYRPPYYGTWRSRSKAITGRRPFTTKDENIDYEIDSDAEWEEEPSDAEECKSDEEDDAGGDSDIDSEHEAFFVEPGYLSAGEGDEGSDDDDHAANEARDTEERRARLAARACEWRSRVLGRKQPAVLVPRCVGPTYSCATAPQTLAALRVVLF